MVEPAPPWQQCPDFTRHTIGWRMGHGEDIFYEWWTFIKTLSTDKQTRLSYFRRHAQAPIPWSDIIHSVLFPEEEVHNGVAQCEQVKKLGLVSSDVAYSNWLKLEPSEPPWVSEEPIMATRYLTRPLWFWSRKAAPVTDLPESWKDVQQAIDPRQGLLALAGMMCSGRVIGPWELGLSVTEEQDIGGLDMGYVGAFRLWCECVLDDAAQVEQLFPDLPAGWSDWLDKFELQ